MDNSNGLRLIDELLAAPAVFVERGRAHALLQEYFAGLSKETLRPLRRSDDVSVQRSAAFVVSELGRDGACLVDELPRLLSSADTHVVWYAMESLAVCARGAEGRLLTHVVLMLESENEPIRRLAMRLLSRVDQEQLETVYFGVKSSESRYKAHVQGWKL